MLYLLFPSLFLSLLYLDVVAPSIFQIKAENISFNSTNAFVHISAVSDNASIHFLVAASGLSYPPAALIIPSESPDAKLKYNAIRLSSQDATLFRDSIEVSPNSGAYGIVFYQFCEYQDAEDRAKMSEADINKCKNLLAHNMDFTLEHFQELPGEDHLIRIKYVANLEKGASIEIQFLVSHAPQPPPDGFYTQLKDGLSLGIRISARNLPVASPRSRFNPVFLLFSNQSLNETDDFLVKKFEGPEYTGPLGPLPVDVALLAERIPNPQLFSRSKIDIPPGYLQFIPVCLMEDKPVTAASLRRASPGPRMEINKSTASKYHFALPYAVFGDRFNQPHHVSTENHVGMRKQYVDVGNPGDGFYQATNYLSWFMVLSLGTPPGAPVTTKTSWVLGTSIGIFVVMTVSAFLYLIKRRYFSPMGRNLSYLRTMVAPPPPPSEIGMPPDELTPSETTSLLLQDTVSSPTSVMPPPYGSIYQRPIHLENEDEEISSSDTEQNAPPY